jgi:DMSO/TMAO reductase YedYZ molybdopterin-dependent catalytic subunit
MNGLHLRFVNTAILTLLLALTLTGLFGLMWPMPSWMFELHRGASWAFVALLPWKAAIAWRSLRRGLDRRFDRSITIGVSILLATMASSILVLGLMWTWRIGPEVVWLGSYGDAVISWHWMLALGVLPLLGFHVWRRWPRPKRADFLSRRSALKLMALGAVGALGWGLAESLARARQSAEASRRFTGSREQGSFSGLGYPVTHTVGQGQIVIDPDTWQLKIGGAVNLPLTLSYAEVSARSTSEITATLDCTSGWYTTQVWRGLTLAGLLAEAGLHPEAAAILLKDVSGYPALLTLAEAEEVLLATHVGGQALDHWHGAPLRAVVPSRRGWQWVKWLTEIEVLATPLTS